jgi:hypothetical protein
MRFMALVLFALAVSGICMALAQSPNPQPNKVADFMRVKLEHSKKLLEALTVEDMNLAAKSSQAISLLSQDATWQVLQTPEYAQRSQAFHRVADRLTEAARKKNLDGAALAYVELTMQCIDCHKYVRDVHSRDK